MGQTDFFAYDGLVRTLDCELRDYVFKDINLLQSSKFAAGVNTQFNEVWFFYCSAGSNEVDRGVIYNYADGTWSKATIARLCWADRGVFPSPIAIDAATTMFQHETGKTANGATCRRSSVAPHHHRHWRALRRRRPMVAGYAGRQRRGEGQLHLPRLAGRGPRTEGPFDFAIGDEFVPLSFSARELQLRIDGNGAWELGLPQISMQGGSLR
jgi:hypothetical protein